MSLRALVVCLLWVAILTASYAFPLEDEPSPTPSTPPASSGPSVDDAKKQAQAAISAATNVESAVAKAEEKLRHVEQYRNDITRVTGTESKPSSSPLDDLRSIDTAVAALQEPTPDLIERLGNEGKAIHSAEDARTTPCSGLDKFKDVTPEVSVAQGKCSDAQKDAAAETSKLDTATSDMRKALGDIYPYAAKQVSAMAERLGPLQNLQPGDASPAADPLLQSLPRNLPVLRQVVSDGSEYQIRWKRTKLRLDKLKITPPDGSPDGGSANDSLQTAVNSIVPKLAGWFQILASFSQDSAKQLDSKISEVETDPGRNSASALDAIRDKADVVAELQSIADAWPPMVAYLVDGKPSTFNLKTTQKNFEALQSSLNTLRGAVARVNDALAGDFSQFETDQVSLYYFTDVKRLMYALNPAFREIGGVAEAQEEAAAQRKTLSESEFELADAQASVNRYQKEVLDLREQQRQIQAKLQGQDSKVSKLASRSRHAQDAKQSAENQYQATQKDQSDHPDDPTKAKAVEQAKVKQDAAEAKSSQAQSDYDGAKSERDATQSQLDSSKSDSDGLPTKMEEAKQSLSRAQAAVSEQRRRMLMAAQAESDAFAFARDNAPFLFAQAVGSSTDPARRVQLYAFNDSKTIFMRGKQEDLNLVKRIIRQFDRPAPQARLTLWTLEMSAEADQKANRQSAERLNGAMQIIDEELSDTRARVNTTLTLFRDLVNAEVQRFETDRYGTHTWQVLQGSKATDADDAKWRRAHFYDVSVLRELGINLKTPDLQRFRRIIPDPSSTTTLGEALMVVSLARPETRQCIHDLFDTQFPERMRALQPILSGNDQQENDKRTARFHQETANIQDPLNRIWEALGVVARSAIPACPAGNATCPAKPSYGVKSGALSSPQREISRALITAYQSAELKRAEDYLQRWYSETVRIDNRLEELNRSIRKLVSDNAKKQSAAAQDQLSQLQSQVTQESSELRRMQVLRGADKLRDEDKKKLDELEKRSDQLKDQTRLILAKSPDDVAAYARYTKEINELQTRLKNLRTDSAPLAQSLMQNYGLTPSFTDDKGSESGMLKFQLNWLRTQPLDSASPRQAAADEMLKELVIAVEDDLDRLFVQPMIVRLRTRLTTQVGVRVGILQRESVLATNRGLARVDPRASAQLAVGEEQDILSGVQQLAQLYTVVQSGGALAALGALQKQPREAQPEVYALTTGNKFQVTPIFDPSGQALRFKFDFVGSSQLQEPNGTTNQQFPRIERHTVNTEVQLTNLETREISRFESNARLGLPTTYWGGVPVLKDIPYVRPWVPLIGWFVRKAGSNASAQQSVIFAQTTIYPTISSIVDLLSETDPQ